MEALTLLVLFSFLVGALITCYRYYDTICRLKVFIKRMREEIEKRKPIPIELWDHCYEFILEEDGEKKCS